MTRVVFWQNLLAFYQVPHITALAALPGFEVTWVVEELLPADRAAQGWSVPQVENVTVVVAPNDEKIAELINDRPGESVHIFSGIHQQAVAKKAFPLCVKTSARIGLLNEPPIPGGLVRNLIVPPYHFIHRLIYGSRISFILAIGHMSVKFYRSIGYAEDIVFPYGYFPEVANPPAFEGPREMPVQLMYLGQLITRKGIDLLLESLSGLAGLNWRLTIMGSGVEETALRQLAKYKSIDDKVLFKPSAPNAEALMQMSKSDVFLLPSRHDGWGTVVNEALICGTPVICSNHCGGSDLLADPWRGSTFEAESTSDLALALKKWIEKGPRTEQETVSIQEWSKCIGSKSVAAYLSSVIEWTGKKDAKQIRPKAPWLS